MQNDPTGSKVSSITKNGGGAWSRYRALLYGDMPWHRVLWAELVMILFSSLGGAPGLWLRSRCYRTLLGAVGANTVFGRNGTIRHHGKIKVGANVIVDDHCLIDAKGSNNRGICLGDNVYVGRNTSIYCKNGDITVGDRVNISSLCTIMSANSITIGEDTVIGAYSYLLSGGEYDYRSEVPFARQSGMHSRGPLSIGKNCWIGTRVTILDAASVGDHCVIGAGSLVTRPIPDHSLALGTPAKVIRTFPRGES